MDRTPPPPPTPPHPFILTSFDDVSHFHVQFESRKTQRGKNHKAREKACATVD